jgi:tellurite resistance protein TerC
VRETIWLWAGFNAFVLAMLALDLGVLRRKAHDVSIREAALWSAIWFVLALGFSYGVHHFAGSRAGFEFLTGYLIEKALSVDNIFVFVLILTYFNVPSKYHHRVLFWGVVGALITRGTMIALGSVLVSRFHWVIYFFGALLLFTAIRMLTARENDTTVPDNVLLRLVRRFVPVTPEYHGQRFFVRVAKSNGLRWSATPLFVVLVTVETTDLIFAVDSIPAIFAVTRDPFIIYTSNVFAILGLRSLYFLLAAVLPRFQYLKTGIALVLIFVGLKMLVADVYDVPIGISLGIVASVLVVSVVASLASVMVRDRKSRRMPPPPEDVPPLPTGRAHRPRERPHNRLLWLTVPLFAVQNASVVPVAPAVAAAQIDGAVHFGGGGVLREYREPS